MRLGLRVPHLGSPHPDMSQVVRWVLSGRGCHALWRVVLVHASCVGCRCALHPAVVALRHLVAPHLGGGSPWLCWRLLISRSVLLLLLRLRLLLLAPNATPACSSPSIARVPMVGVTRVSWVVMVVGGHAVHGRCNVRWALAGAVLGHHSSCRGAGLLVARVGAMVVHLPQFGLRRARSGAVEHPLVVTPVPLVLMVQGGVSLLG